MAPSPWRLRTANHRIRPGLDSPQSSSKLSNSPSSYDIFALVPIRRPLSHCSRRNSFGSNGRFGKNGSHRAVWPCKVASFRRWTFKLDESFFVSTVYTCPPSQNSSRTAIPRRSDYPGPFAYRAKRWRSIGKVTASCWSQSERRNGRRTSFARSASPIETSNGPVRVTCLHRRISNREPASRYECLRRSLSRTT